MPAAASPLHVAQLVTALKRWAAATVLACVAGSAWAHGDLHERILALSAEIAAHPDDARLYRARADLYREHGEPEPALVDLDRVAALEPGSPRLHLAYALVRADQGRWVEARAELDRQLLATPCDGQALTLRGNAEERLGAHGAAIADFTAAIAQAIADNDVDPELYCARARASAALGDEHLAEAIRGLDDGCERLGSPIALMLLAVDLETRSGAIDAALERLDRIVAASQAKDRWLARRGDLLAAAGRAGEARSAYAAALAAIAGLPEDRRGNPETQALAQRLDRSISALALGGGDHP